MTDRPLPTIEELRLAVRERLTKGSNLRELADEIGVSHSGLHAFERGQTDRPQAETRVELTRWFYARNRTTSGIPRDQIEMAISILRAYWDDRSKSKALRRRRRKEILDRVGREIDT